MIMINNMFSVRRFGFTANMGFGSSLGLTFGVGPWDFSLTVVESL